MRTGKGKRAERRKGRRKEQGRSVLVAGGLVQRASRCSGGWSLGRARPQERGDGQRSLGSYRIGRWTGRKNEEKVEAVVGRRCKIRSEAGEDLDRVRARVGPMLKTREGEERGCW